MNRLAKLLVVGAALAASTSMGSTAHGAPGVPFTNDNIDRIFGSGSGVTLGLMEDLAGAYVESDGCALVPLSFPPPLTPPTPPDCLPLGNSNIYENYDHDLPINYHQWPGHANTGRGQLCNQAVPSKPGVKYVDFARSASAPNIGFQCTVATGGQAGTVLRFIAFARTGITFTHWNTGTGGGSLVDNLTVAQLRDIFITCAITDWSQVAGPAAPINVHTAVQPSETRTLFEVFLGGGDSSTCIPGAFKDGNPANGERLIPENQALPVEVALNDPAAADEGNSISYSLIAAWNSDASRRSNSLLGRVNNIAPTEANIVGGSFPLSHYMYNVIRQAGPQPTGSGAVRRFLGMLTSTATNGQSIGWICKAEQNHSEQVGNPSPIGIETPTATRDWFEVKKATFAANGYYQLAPDLFGNRCVFTDV